ncbi:MAG: hypothetical protein H7Z74_01145 [Anaerolineae bacterium]|nr:hypothetical protein [Gemmatimonadaceae bacterium]
MRLETIPLILGGLFGLMGLVLLADAVIRDGSFAPTERRQRARAQRNLWGEAILGFGILAVAAALIGRDVWRYTTVAMLAALVLCVLGLALNWRYVASMLAGRPSGRVTETSSRSSKPTAE